MFTYFGSFSELGLIHFVAFHQTPEFVVSNLHATSPILYLAWILIYETYSSLISITTSIIVCMLCLPASMENNIPKQGATISPIRQLITTAKTATHLPTAIATINSFTIAIMAFTATATAFAMAFAAATAAFAFSLAAWEDFCVAFAVALCGFCRRLRALFCGFHCLSYRFRSLS